MGILPSPRSTGSSRQGIRTTIPSKVTDEYVLGTDYLRSPPQRVPVAVSARQHSISPRHLIGGEIESSSLRYANAAAAMGQMAFPAQARTDLGRPAPPQRAAQQSSLVAVSPRRWVSPPLLAFSSIEPLPSPRQLEDSVNQFNASASLSRRSPRLQECMVLPTTAGTLQQTPQFAQREEACLESYYQANPSRSPRRANPSRSIPAAPPLTTTATSMSSSSRSSRKGATTNSCSGGGESRSVKVNPDDEREERRQQEELEVQWFNSYAVMRDIGNFEKKKWERENGPLLPPVA